MAKPYHSTLDRSSLDRLESLHAAYVGLEVLAGMSDGTESRHVAVVLAIINEALQTHIDALAPKPSPGVVPLRPVRG